MPGTCILSLDCESKWGMADALSAAHDAQFTNDSIADIYQWLLARFEQTGIPATYAFVGAMTTPQETFVNDWLPQLTANPEHAAWLARLIQDIRDNQVDGWFVPSVLDEIQSASVPHEIATHGFTHLPMQNISEASLALEAAGINDWAARNALELKTLIYPRHYVDMRLLEAVPSLLGYREHPYNGKDPDLRIKLGNLAGEFYPFPPSRRDASTLTRPAIIPVNFFLNWRAGARRWVPTSLTVQRFRHALAHAAKHDGVVHWWFHPHNLMTGKDQRALFEQCLALLHDAKESQRIEVLTQIQYIESKTPQRVA